MSEKLLIQVSEFVAAQMGLAFPPERWPDLERGIASAARAAHAESAESFASRLLAAPPTREQIQLLASHLTVGETYFFRDPTFSIIEERILPEVLRLRRDTDRRLRIWSAGCASGEEAYSIAILLHKLLPDLERWNITILGTDINPRALEKAIQGVYSSWSFRQTPAWVCGRYFKKSGNGRFQISPSIQRMVTFFHLNLAEDTYPSLSNNTNAMDVILCRNVLMYFGVKKQEEVVDRLHLSLPERGWLLVSPSEVSNTLSSRFEAVHFPSAIFYRKGNASVHGHELASPAANVGRDWTFVTNQAAEVESKLAGASEETKDSAGSHEEAFAVHREGRYPQTTSGPDFGMPERPADSAAVARAYANKGQLGDALMWCERAIAADKMNASCHYLRALILQEQGLGAAAIGSLRRAIYLDPYLVMAHFALGNLALRQGRTKEAKRHFANSLSLLASYRREDVLPEADGMSAGRLMEVIHSTITCAN